MIRRSRQQLVLWFLTWDLICTALSWMGAYLLRFKTGWVEITRTVPDFDLYLSTLPIVLVLAAVSYRFVGLYEVHRLRRLREDLIGTLKGVSLLQLLILATVFFRHSHYESRMTMLMFYGMTIGSMFLARRMSWLAIRFLRKQGFNQSPALIIGTGRVARRAEYAIRNTGWTGMHVLGFVEDRPNRWSSDLNILGKTVDLPRLIDEHEVRHVFIALPLNRYDEARKVFDILSQTTAEVRLIADVPSMAGLSLTTTALDGLPIIGLRESPHFGLNIVIKRAMDVLLASIALVLLSPLMGVIALVVKLTSPGPVFYRQERCSLNEQPFEMLKFRSMKMGAETQTGAVWAAKDDPRRTWFGAFIRKTSLDELPQLINVLMGDMSLVGPRPERPVFIKQFRRTIPNYVARHCVKAGITGWAQVHGWRGNTSLRKRVEYDLYYITHWNPLLDFRILWLTVLRGLLHRNAY